jgi:hypothetical protein
MISTQIQTAQTDTTPRQALTLEELVKAIKEDVRELIKVGQIPRDVATFSELHDHCDANCLGGLCLDATFDALWAHHATDPSQEGMPQGMLDVINQAQSAVNDWLASGEAAREE